MKFKVHINVSVNPYIKDFSGNETDQPSYTQNLMFAESHDIDAANWTEMGTIIDALVTGIKEGVEHAGSK